MPKSIKGVAVAGLALGAATVSLFLAFGGREQKIDLGPYDVLGAVTAEEAASLLSNKGQVLLMVPDTGENQNPSVEAELRAFQQALKKQPGLSMIIEKVSVTAMLMMATGGGVPADELFRAIDAHKSVDVLVLFFRFPSLTDAQIQRLNLKRMKVIVVSSIYPDYERLFDRGTIHLAIVPRDESPPPGRTPQTLRERFDQEFMIIKPQSGSRSR